MEGQPATTVALFTRVREGQEELLDSTLFIEGFEVSDVVDDRSNGITEYINIRMRNRPVVFESMAEGTEGI